MEHFGYGPHLFGLGFLNFVGTLLFIFFIVMLIRFALRGAGYARCGHGGRWVGRGGPPWTQRSAPHDPALAVARERLAKSEISAEEYEALRAGLAEGTPAEGSPADWFGRRDSALETARMRFAQGEISREEFEAVRKALQS